ncbi:hypothetical protein NAPIS_ORF00280 [Vairimorpha apis BRL 01]|uniref:Uncharacterized protein n=1 Tax=Vairimorpha apis BRL 01 TaxID=1037528 RepID=T0L3T1_9MICR|nr:hypothetical protein NAPIS_ORF00280 [Vairimorpha apis BRL 01]
MLELNNFIIILLKIICASNITDVNKKYLNIKNMNDELDQLKIMLLEETKNYIEFVNFNINKSFTFKKDNNLNPNIDNKILESNMASSKLFNKRAHDKDEPINLSAKVRRLENTSSFQDININATSRDKRFFEYNIHDIETNYKNIDTTESFIYIVKIIENELINTLKNSIIFSILHKDYIVYIIANLENLPFNDQKINFLIKVTNEIMSKDINVKFDNNNYKQIFIEQILSTKYYKNHNRKKIYYKLLRKAKLINLNIIEKNLTYDEIFYKTIDYINQINDKKIQCLFVLGFQSLFDRFSNDAIPRLYYVLTFLHTFILDKKNYDLNWYEKFFNILSLSYFKIRNVYRYYKIIDKYFEQDLNKEFPIYIAMNSEKINVALQNYKDLQNNVINLNYVNYLINLTNKIKCKLFGIKFESY